MSQWTNEYAIMRDLTIAQGCVPVDLNGTVLAGQRPPPQNIVEETEEEFFRHYVGDEGDEQHTGPDLMLIQQMLDMVRELNVSAIVEDEASENIVEISKLNPLSPEFKPKQISPVNTENSIKCKELKLKNRKINKKNFLRNVAITSLLESVEEQMKLTIQNEEANIPEENEDKRESLKLLKPNDFTLPLYMTESLEKVNGWFDAQETNKTDIQGVFVGASSMFKKRKSNSEASSVKATSETKKSPAQTGEKYIPSSQANEYYQKYLERNRVKETVKEDIWAKAEREMKELDAKRQKESAESSMASQSSPVTSSEYSDKKFDAVRLPMHRHLLMGDCTVCKVLCKNPPSSNNGRSILGSEPTAVNRLDN